MNLKVFFAFGIGFVLGLLMPCATEFRGHSPPPPQSARNSLQPAALAMPIAGIDPFKLKDTFYEMHNGHRHEALDIMAPRGTPVLAVDRGSVAKLFTSKQGGLTVYEFNDTQQLCYYYAHLDHYASDLKEGQPLNRGQIIGYVGSTGNASPDAPHLHFAVSLVGPEHHWWQTTAIDPLPMLQGRGQQSPQP